MLIARVYDPNEKRPVRDVTLLLPGVFVILSIPLDSLPSSLIVEIDKE